MSPGPDMERILIATDGSDSAREALHVGVELAAEQGTSVTIVHVVEQANAEDGNGLRADKDAALSEAVEMARHAELEPEIELLAGDVADQVAELAERIDADLVIVGSRGLGRASASLLGSVSRSTLDRCKRPVMVVRGRRPLS